MQHVKKSQKHEKHAKHKQLQKMKNCKTFKNVSVFTSLHVLQCFEVFHVLHFFTYHVFLFLFTQDCLPFSIPLSLSPFLPSPFLPFSLSRAQMFIGCAMFISKHDVTDSFKDQCVRVDSTAVHHVVI